MKQVLQNLKTGEIILAELPVPSCRKNHVVIKNVRSVISLGTERMLLEFGKANIIEKALRQPEKVKQVIQKIKTDGLLATLESVQKKLDQPLAMGYSSAGIIIETSPEINEFKVGDRVISNGPHAEYVCVPANLCAKIPENVDFDTAAFTVISSIALQGVRLVQPTLGETICIIGLGLIGLITVQILSANGCKVIGFDYDESKIKLAQEYGAYAYNLSSNLEPISIAKEHTEGFGVDGVIITAATSSNEPIELAQKLCRKRGRIVLVGVSSLNLSRDDFYKKELTFQVSCSYGPGRYEVDYEQKGLDYPIGYVRWTEQRNFKAVLDLMAKGKIDIKKLISKRFNIEDAHNAYDLVLNSGGLLGVILEYNNETNIQRIIQLSSSQFSSIAKPFYSHACSNKCSSQDAKYFTNTNINHSKLVRVGFIGAGNFTSAVLLPEFAKTDAELVSIASSTGVSAYHLGKKYNFKTITTDYKYILEDPTIDLVVITTQHASHAKFIKEALNAKKNVFVEKPLCTSIDELNQIVETYKQISAIQPILLMVGFNRRFSPLTIKCKELLKDIISPKSIIITINAGSIPSEHWVHDPDIGGGRIIGEACHFIDLARYLVGYPITSCSSSYMQCSDKTKKEPDTASLLLSFEDGSIATINYFSNGNKDFPKERIEIFCDNKILQIDNFIALYGYGFRNFKSEKLWFQDKGHQYEIKSLIEALKFSRPSPISFDEIVEVTQVTLLASNTNLPYFKVELN